MRQLYVFGTGHALVTKLYNSCFGIREQDFFLILDAGGGNGILSAMDAMNVPCDAIRSLFFTHTHTPAVLPSMGTTNCYQVSRPSVKLQFHKKFKRSSIAKSGFSQYPMEKVLRPQSECSPFSIPAVQLCANLAVGFSFQTVKRCSTLVTIQFAPVHRTMFAAQIG